MAAIRIIRSTSASPPPDRTAIDRDEMVRSIAERIAEASGNPDRLDECARKLRAVANRDDDTEELLQAIDHGLQEAMSPIGVHAELDLTRIFSLLED